MVAGMLMPLDRLRAIYEILFRDGVMVAKNDERPQSRHAEVPGVTNLQVTKAMGSLRSRGFVKETFVWRHCYWYLTNEGIGYLRQYLHLPPEIVPASLQRVRRPMPALGVPRRTQASNVQTVRGPTSYAPKPQDEMERRAYRKRDEAVPDRSQESMPGLFSSHVQDDRRPGGGWQRWPEGDSQVNLKNGARSSQRPQTTSVDEKGVIKPDQRRVIAVERSGVESRAKTSSYSSETIIKTTVVETVERRREVTTRQTIQEQSGPSSQPSAIEWPVQKREEARNNLAKNETGNVIPGVTAGTEPQNIQKEQGRRKQEAKKIEKEKLEETHVESLFTLSAVTSARPPEVGQNEGPHVEVRAQPKVPGAGTKQEPVQEAKGKSKKQKEQTEKKLEMTEEIEIKKDVVTTTSTTKTEQGEAKVEVREQRSGKKKGEKGKPEMQVPSVPEPPETKLEKSKVEADLKEEDKAKVLKPEPSKPEPKGRKGGQESTDKAKKKADELAKVLQPTTSDPPKTDSSLGSKEARKGPNDNLETEKKMLKSTVEAILEPPKTGTKPELKQEKKGKNKGKVKSEKEDSPVEPEPIPMVSKLESDRTVTKLEHKTTSQEKGVQGQSPEPVASAEGAQVLLKVDQQPKTSQEKLRKEAETKKKKAIVEIQEKILVETSSKHLLSEAQHQTSPRDQVDRPVKEEDSGKENEQKSPCSKAEVEQEEPSKSSETTIRVADAMAEVNLVPRSEVVIEMKSVKQSVSHVEIHERWTEEVVCTWTSSQKLEKAEKHLISEELLQSGSCVSVSKQDDTPVASKREDPILLSEPSVMKTRESKDDVEILEKKETQITLASLTVTSTLGQIDQHLQPVDIEEALLVSIMQPPAIEAVPTMQPPEPGLEVVIEDVPCEGKLEDVLEALEAAMFSQNPPEAQQPKAGDQSPEEEEVMANPEDVTTKGGSSLASEPTPEGQYGSSLSPL